MQSIEFIALLVERRIGGRGRGLGNTLVSSTAQLEVAINVSPRYLKAIRSLFSQPTLHLQEGVESLKKTIIFQLDYTYF